MSFQYHDKHLKRWYLFSTDNYIRIIDPEYIKLKDAKYIPKNFLYNSGRINRAGMSCCKIKSPGQLEADLDYGFCVKKLSLTFQVDQLTKELVDGGNDF